MDNRAALGSCQYNKMGAPTLAICDMGLLMVWGRLAQHCGGTPRARNGQNKTVVGHSGGRKGGGWEAMQRRAM
jgi:hypothetical protein